MFFLASNPIFVFVQVEFYTNEMHLLSNRISLTHTLFLTTDYG